MNYPVVEQVTVRLADGQKEWLYSEADRQMANISTLVRRAVKLLREQIEKERKQ